MNKFLIVANTDKDINLKLSQDIVAYIREKGAQAVVVSDEQRLQWHDDQARIHGRRRGCDCAWRGWNDAPCSTQHWNL